MVETRKVTPIYPGPELAADEFRCGPSYTNWRPNGSNDWLLIYTAHGSGRFTADRGQHDTSPGEAVLYHPSDPQDYRTSENAGKWHLLWAHFTLKPGWQQILNWKITATGVRLLWLPTGTIRDGFSRALQRTISLCRQRFTGSLDLAANALEESLLWANVAALNSATSPPDLRIQRAQSYLAENSKDPFSLEALARHCGLSVSRLSFLFKREVGLTPQKFWERIRIQRASQLLRKTRLSISEIAAEVGFEDPFYFTNRFRNFTKKSPSAFRKDWTTR
jgi:AraC family transcriptional regulator of arabinose operon